MLLTPLAVAAAAAETAAVAADTAAAVAAVAVAVADTAAAVAAVVAEFGAVALVSYLGAQEDSLPGLGPRPRPGRFAPPLCGGPLVQAGRLRLRLRGPRGRR